MPYDLYGHKTKSKTIAEWPGDVDSPAAAAKTVSGTANAGVPVILRFFADEVDDAARAENTIQQRS